MLIIFAALIGLDGDAFTRMTAIGCYVIGGIGCVSVAIYHFKTNHKDTV